MVDRPTVLPRWATSTTTSSETGVSNWVEPPESKKNVGWNFGEPPARQFFNWKGRMTYEWLRYLDDETTFKQITTDGMGRVTINNVSHTLFNKENSLIILFAVDKVTPANYLFAIGYRGEGAPSLNIISNNVLALGGSDTDGAQVISGGNAEDIIAYGISKNIIH